MDAKVTWGSQHKPGFHDSGPMFPERPRGGGGGGYLHPWALYRTMVGSSARVAVAGGSRLFDVIGLTESEITVSGIGSTFAPAIGFGLFLHGSVSTSTGGVVSVEIGLYADDGEIITFDDGTTERPPRQTDFYYPIARFLASAPPEVNAGYRFDGSIFIAQAAFTHLRMMSYCTADGVVTYPAPA